MMGTGLTRRRIYDKYIGMGITCVEEIGIVEVNEAVYEVYFDRSIDFMFASCERIFYGLGDITEEINGKKYNILRIDAQSLIPYGDRIIPCIEFSVDLTSFYLDGDPYVIDFTHGDLSNILSFSLIHDYDNDYHSYIPYEIRYPKGNKGLKPISSVGIASCIKYEEALNSVDISEAIIIDCMLARTDISEFDLSSINTGEVVSTEGMFRECTNLKRVYGHIKYGDSVRTGSMFDGCVELTSVDKDVFEGARIDNAAYMFNECANLKENPINCENFKGYSGLASSYEYMYYGCSKLNNNDIINTLLPLEGYIDCRDILPNKCGNVKFGEVNLCGGFGYIFADCEFGIVDLSAVTFTSNTPFSDFQEMFCGEAVIHSEFVTYYLPQIIIINDSVPLPEDIKEAVTFLDFRGIDKELLDAKVKLLDIMDNHDRKYIILADK